MKSALKLPWAGESVPHAVLDILRGCNIRCRDCYNLAQQRLRTPDEIEAQLDTLQRLRRLQSVSIVGGEPTLHPKLAEIVRRIRRRGLCVEIFTNGVALDDTLLALLKHAGANVIFLHVEPGQRRPDLPFHATTRDVRILRTRLAERVASHGIEVGLAATAYPDGLDEVADIVSLTIDSPLISYLLVTWWRDVAGMPPLRGDLATGLETSVPAKGSAAARREPRAAEFGRWMKDRFGLTPFAFLGSNRDLDDPRWLSFLVSTVHRREHLERKRSVRATAIERGFLAATRWATGQYPFYQSQRPAQTALHLLLNGIAGGGLGGNLALIASAVLPAAHLGAKRLLFQWPASLDEHGRLVHCASCPDAVLKDGRLVPLCISDRVVGTDSPAHPACAGAVAKL